MACNDAHIALCKTKGVDSKDCYEIVIGGWKNSKSVIRVEKQGKQKDSEDENGIINCTEYRQFWISWESGEIRVGKGDDIGKKTFLNWNDGNPHPVTDIGISTGWGARGKWKFSPPGDKEEDDDKDEEDKVCRRRINCISTKRGYKECSVPMKIKRIKLKKNKGVKRCKKNKNYGIKSRNTIYVKNGCGGKFAVFCNKKRRKRDRKRKWWRRKQRDDKKCGENAEKKGRGNKCRCKRDYYGDPYVKCLMGCNCRIGGDTHTTMYNKQKLHNQGICMYTLTRSKIPNDECAFNIEVKQEHRGSRTHVSFLRMLRIEMYNTIIELLQGRKVYINGTLTYTPYENADFKITAPAEGKTGILTIVTTCDIIITWDGRHKADVTVPDDYAGYMDGMCGNCDGDSKAYLTKNGTDVRDNINKHNILSESYQVPDTSDAPTPGCNATVELPYIDTTCSSEALKDVKTKAACGNITSEALSTPFKNCIVELPMEAKSAYENCQYDFCMTYENFEDKRDSICNNLDAFALTCEEKGHERILWRTAYCSPECAENTHYEPFASQNPRTCANLNEDPEDFPLQDSVEACVCNSGYVLSDSKCVKETECGCVKGEVYFPLGSKMLNEDCTIEEECVNENDVRKMKRTNFNGCGPNKKCEMTDGKRACVCKDGFIQNGNECEEPKEEDNNEDKKACRRIVSCSSWKYRYAECKLPIRAIRIRLKKQVSKTRCRKNKNFGLKSRNKMYVNNGCRGQFVVSCKGRNRRRRRYRWWRRKHRDSNKCGINAKRRGRKRCVCNKKHAGDPYTECYRACTCRIGGDPHITTYDGQRIHFQGNCMYLLTQVKSPEDGCGFSVEVKQEFRGSRTDVTFVRMLKVRMFGLTIEMRLGRKLYINGQREFPPFSDAGKNFEIFAPPEGTAGVITIFTTCNQTIKWDGRHKAEVIVPEFYAGYLDGMCGNCDGDKADFILRNGTDVGNLPDKHNLVGESYQVNDTSDAPTEGCNKTVDEPFVVPEPCLSSSSEIAVLKNNPCRLIYSTNDSNPFKECILFDQDAVNGFFKDCEYDFCMFYPKTLEEAHDMVCRALDNFAMYCEENGLEKISWRKAANCPVICGDHAHYEMHTCPIQKTCKMPKLDNCNLPAIEACVCDDEYLLSGDKCVPKNECGCTDGKSDKYYPLNFRLISSDCTTEQICVEEGDVRKFKNNTDYKRCSSKEKCGMVEGFPKCVCADGYFKNADSECEEIPPAAGPCNFETTQKDCSSEGGKTMCTIDNSIEIHGITAISTTCEFGSYGIENGKIFVDNGCSGTFEVCYKAGINECEDGSHTCDVNAQCVDTNEHYECICNNGFKGDGQSCTDIDECETKTDTCDDNADCSNTVGSFECVCKQGFRGNGLSCNDVDECAEKSDKCDSNAECSNDVGSYKCSCKNGFKGDGFSCNDVDECAEKTDKCDSNADCSNDVGGYKCACKNGFKGDGFSCNDVDECAEKIDQCDSNADCTNEVGEYKCACKNGFKGDGFSCNDVDECAEETDECDSNADCSNEDGGYKCACKNGFKGNGFSCNDVDECAEKTDECDFNADCSNKVGGYTCACKSGFKGNGFSCTDVDECIEKTDNCNVNADCINTIGGYNCECKDGFRGNGKSCNDIDECAEKTHTCDNHADCSNTVGSYDCSCKRGFRGNGKSCVDIDECAEGTDTCDDNAECTNIDAGFECKCKPGYTGNGHICDESNECADGSHSCSERERCINTEGGFDCECKHGYVRNGQNCDDINECEKGTDTCDSNAECSNTIGGYTCTCKNGYSGNGFMCEDINECQDETHTCSPNAGCTNTDGSFTCTCKPGFKGDGFTCEDTNECEEETAMCDENAECTNNIGSYECECKPGFIGNGMICVDINECQTGSAKCDVNAGCSNTDGSYKCTCKTGFRGDGHTCDDINECVEGSNQCNANADCLNNEGSYECKCKDGFTGDGYSCTDINECQEGKDQCDDNAGCKNTNGGYECACNAGFMGDGKSCTDVDECQEGSDQCDVNAECFNKDGSYSCTCKSGFTGDGYSCSDIDECQEGKDQCDNNAGCTNTNGGYTCTCNDGFNGDGKSCTDIDECLDGSAKCNSNADCMNNVGSYTCTCKTGFIGDGFDCVDIDECKAGSAKCDENADCMNIEGGYVCTCKDGFAGNGHSCNDINECERNIDTCNDNAECSNTIGSFSCECKNGFQGDGFSCEDIDECENKIDTCNENADCSNTVGGYNCECKQGFRGNGRSCDDIDECAEKTHTCDQHAECSDTEGSFTCTCKRGFRGDGHSCVDKDECAEGTDTCDDNAECTNTEGAFECECKPGYTGNGYVCDESNECADGTHSCSERERCMNTEGGYECVCKHGYVRNGQNCDDVDECIDKTDTCDTNADCANTVGGYECTCKNGFLGNGFMCDDINECEDDTHTCSQNANCKNTDGSFYCDCKPGFRKKEFACVDVDECAEELDKCDVNADCSNNAGSYTCMCKGGFTGDGYTCNDIDECVLDTDQCDENADCSNTAGSYTCKCKNGFHGDGYSCTDVDECIISSDPCDENADCSNTEGGYTCSCKDGFVGDGFSCTDVNECVDGSHQCNVKADCTNTEGSYTCKCKDGFTGDGYNCIDTDECVEGSHQCNVNADCTNTEGSYTCKCKDGFSGNGYSCIDIDECIDGSDQCDANADCTNTEGSYTCKCKDGFTGNGYSCTDINECMDGSEQCDVNAGCTNTEGSYTCKCKDGFTGDGYSCTDIDECIVGPNQCDVNADCANTAGSYTCTCKEGFTGDGYSCAAIEPEPSVCDNCDKNADCFDNQCLCRLGFTGNGQTCTVVCEDTVSIDCLGSTYQTCKLPDREHKTIITNASISEDFTSNGCSRSMYGFTKSFVWVTDGCDATFSVCLMKVPSDCRGQQCGDNAICDNQECVCKPGYSKDSQGQCKESCKCTVTTGVKVNGFGPENDFVKAGPCTYTLAKTSNGVCDFEVLITNEDKAFGNAKATVIKSIRINMANFRLEINSERNAVINGNQAQLSYGRKIYGDLLIVNNVQNIRIKNLKCGFEVVWVGESNLLVYAPNQAADSATGLCGKCTNDGTGPIIPEDHLDPQDAGCRPNPSNCFPALRNAADGICQQYLHEPTLSCISGEYNWQLQACFENICPFILFNDMATINELACDQLDLVVYQCAAINESSSKKSSCASIETCTDQSQHRKTSLCTSTCDNPDADVTCPYADIDHCGCNTGYVRNKGGNCVPVNACECLVTNNDGSETPVVCHQNGYCDVNECKCSEGYTGDGITECEPSVVFATRPQKDQTRPPTTAAPTPITTERADTNTLKDTVIATTARADACGGFQICDDNASCIGGTDCECNPGFSGDGLSCTDINECDAGTNNCDGNAECDNTIGSFTCTCKTGFTGDGVTCSPIDVNECEDGTDTCDDNADCTNTIDGFTCTCKVGFTGDGFSCTDINECQADPPPCNENADCSNLPGSFECNCKPGFTGDGVTCDDINECQADPPPCNENADCSNLPGSFECNCKPGFTGDGVTCEDINECQADPPPCNENADCSNLPGSFECNCKPGFTGDGVTCEDIDECQAGQPPCDENADCSNIPGSFKCKCKPGFTGNGLSCEDINECQKKPNICGKGECDNTVGGYTCVCDDGYRFDGSKCKDINECTENTAKCHKKAKCVNKPGRYDCKCIRGYKGDGKNECKKQCGRNLCHENAQCKRRKCICLNGFYGDGVQACNDTCGGGECGKFAVCENNECKCVGNYWGIGTKGCNKPCGGKPCAIDAQCKRRKCKCKPGYIGNGQVCERECHCSVSGDPFYKSFDNQPIRFNGQCKYILSRTKTLRGGFQTCDYKILVKNNRNGKKAKDVSVTEYIEFHIFGHVVKLHHNKMVEIDGMLVNLPSFRITRGGSLVVYYSGKYVVVDTTCKVRLAFNGKSVATLTVRGPIGEHLDGICGSCDGMKNDYKLENGTDVMNHKDKFVLIGDSYRVDSGDDPVEGCGTTQRKNPCSKRRQKRIAGNACKIIKAGRPFKKCIRANKQLSLMMFEACTYDHCANGKEPRKKLKDIVCEALEGFARMCEMLGYRPRGSWREKARCSLKKSCGENMAYNYNGKGCPKTCGAEKFPFPCELPKTDGCNCKRGYSLSGDKCTKKCGCYDNGNYYPAGVVMVNADCSEKVCNAGKRGGLGTFKDIGGQCHPDAVCGVDHGVRQCKCLPGFNGDGVTICKPETECSITEDTENCNLTITLRGECTKNSTTNNRCKFRAVTVKDNDQHIAYIRIYEQNKQIRLSPGDPPYNIRCAEFKYGEDKILVIKEKICDCDRE